MNTTAILKQSVLAGLLFGFFFGIYLILCYGFAAGSLGAAASGVAFGSFIAAFTYSESRYFLNHRPDFLTGTLLLQGGANHMLKYNGVGGWLYLTDTLFVFESHLFNFQIHALQLPVSDITKVTTGMTLGILKNRLFVTTKEGVTEQFIVWEAEAWKKQIERLTINKRAYTERV